MLQVLASITCNCVNRVDKPYVWPLLLKFVFAVYLLTMLTIPIAGKAAAGVLLLLGLGGLYRLKKQHYVLIKSEKWLLFSFALFSVVSIVSFFYWPQTRDARMHLEDYVTFMMLLPLYLLLRQFRFDFMFLIVLFSAAAFELGALSLLSNNARPSGDVNPMRYGNISLVLAVIPLAAMLLVRNKVLSFKLLLIVASVLGLTACFLTQSRGALLSIPVLAFLYSVYLYRTGHPKFLIFFVAGAVLIVAAASQQDRVQRSFSSVDRYAQGDSRSALGARFDMFKAAGVLIKQNPVFGHGLNSYSPLATEIRRSTPGMSYEVGLWANPHNEVLQVMVEKGVIGLITLLLLFAAPGYLFLQALGKADDSGAGQQIKFYALSGLSLLVVYAVAGQSVALFEHDVFNHFFALMVLLFASQIRVIGYMEGGAESEA
ncbi:MAG: O-antigen ligase family protein [Bermanella sp.]